MLLSSSLPFCPPSQSLQDLKELERRFRQRTDHADDHGPPPTPRVAREPDLPDLGADPEKSEPGSDDDVDEATARMMSLVTPQGPPTALAPEAQQPQPAAPDALSAVLLPTTTDEEQAPLDEY